MRGVARPSVLVNDNKDGTYFCSYTCPSSGAYSLDVLVHGGSHVQGSPFAVTCTSGITDAERCVISGEGAHSAVAGDWAQFSVKLHDTYGEPKIVGGEAGFLTVHVSEERRWSPYNPNLAAGTLTAHSFLLFSSLLFSSLLFSACFVLHIAGSSFSKPLQPLPHTPPRCRPHCHLQTNCELMTSTTALT
jgi:hypothetical protein